MRLDFVLSLDVDKFLGSIRIVGVWFIKRIQQRLQVLAAILLGLPKALIGALEERFLRLGEQFV